jgi:hypothetical protein
MGLNPIIIYIYIYLKALHITGASIAQSVNTINYGLNSLAQRDFSLHQHFAVALWAQ